ncbi:sialate O-acetylesterase [Ligilactobacillus sp. WILCCON 0076]|uniref:Sialate O-acetylesterase n=1 Tax=Ligilactobacillus ubinensis TaxID=2876789 RepID=A0A9X2FMS5_9LACO|nr:sialate O-acetylesterase [Ligilactobacillus ubinensis]MCP0887028.1 sialate O-acetylesterase [Ligilactobacillus ubinensis]
MNSNKEVNNNLKLPPIFQDGMILQKDTPIHVWGKYIPNTNIQISIENDSVTTVTDTEGSFKANLSQHPANNGIALIFKSNNIILKSINIKIGEVWLLAGQSNMDFNLLYDSTYQKNPNHVTTILTTAGDISFFEVPKKIKLNSKIDMKNHPGEWHKLNKDNAKFFSAIGYYFGIKLSNKIPKCPIGLIWMTYGGTTASAWISKDALTSDSVLNKTYIQSYEHLLTTRPVDGYENFLKTVARQNKNPEIEPFWSKVLAGKIDHDTLQKAFDQHHELFVDYVLGPESENRPHGLFDTMVSTIYGYRVRAILWYQGESDDQHAEAYDYLLLALINNWRTLWGYKIPFLIMQLAPFEHWFGSFKGEFYPEIRQKQANIADTVSAVYLTNIMDDGARFDIHPKNKSLAAERFFLLASDKIYNYIQNGQTSKIIKHTVIENNILLMFDNCTQLELNPLLTRKVLFVKVNGTTTIIDKISSKINILTISLHSNIKVSDSICVYYQQQPYSHASIFNENNIPIRPFKISL